MGSEVEMDMTKTMDRADGYADGVFRTMGCMADGRDKEVEYLRGLEAALTETLNRIREAIGHAETMALLQGEE